MRPGDVIRFNDEGWRTALVAEVGRKNVGLIYITDSLSRAVAVHAFPMRHVTTHARELEYEGRAAARALLKAHRRMGGTKRAKQLLNELRKTQ